MTDKLTVLTDVDERIWLDTHRIEGPTEPTPSGTGNRPSIDKWTIRGGPGDGIDVVDVDNGRFSASILPTRGMGLWKARYDALDLGWRSPVQRPVHPALVRPGDNGGSGWLAGFNELLARCGLASHGPPTTDAANGQTTTLHGNIANLPAHRRLDLYFKGFGPWYIFILMWSGLCIFAPYTRVAVSALGPALIGVHVLLFAWSSVTTWALFRSAYGYSRSAASWRTVCFYLGVLASILTYYLLAGQLIPLLESP